MQEIQGLSPERVKQPIKSRSQINNVCLLTGAMGQIPRSTERNFLCKNLLEETARK